VNTMRTMLCEWETFSDIVDSVVVVVVVVNDNDH
jgi:hypothetical protein